MKRVERVVYLPVYVSEDIHKWLKNLGFNKEIHMRDLATFLLKHFKDHPELVEELLKENKK